MPRNPHTPTPEKRQIVQQHATLGTDQESIARIIGIDAKTLRLHYRDELDLATAKANATIGGALFNKAKGGDTTAMIFWMKTRAGWSEKSLTEITGRDGGPIQTEAMNPDVASAIDAIARKLASGGDAAKMAGQGET